MDLSYIASHTVKPAFVAGQNYRAKVEASVEKDSGFTLELSFADLDTPAFWHFNVAEVTDEVKAELGEELTKRKLTAKRIADDDLKHLVDTLEAPIADSQDFVGLEFDVRLTADPGSTLPNVGLPIVRKRGNGLSI